MPKTILLDVDGTLIDSNDAHAKAWIEALDEAGIEVPYPAVRKKIGMGTDQLLPRLTNITAESNEGQRLAHRQGEIYRTKYVPQLKAFGGTRELLLRLRREGFQLAIATSGNKEALEFVLKTLHLDDLHLPIISGEHVAHSKPEPDVVHAALEHVGGRPEDAIMIGDTPYDIGAAHKAGVRVIALTSGGWTKEDLHEAEAVYEDAKDLLHNFESSLLGTSLPDRAAS